MKQKPSHLLNTRGKRTSRARLARVFEAFGECFLLIVLPEDPIRVHGPPQDQVHRHLLGAASIWFSTQLLGDGKDVTQLALSGQFSPILFSSCWALKPLARSRAWGAMRRKSVHAAWSVRFISAGAVLAATTQGPISAEVVMMELTGHDRACVVPTVIAIDAATVVARTIGPRSNYDARFTYQELRDADGEAPERDWVCAVCSRITRRGVVLRREEPASEHEAST
jgi:hypothetical protein